jgi:cytochrome P450
VTTVTEATVDHDGAGRATAIRSSDGRPEPARVDGSPPSMPPGPRLPRWLQTLAFIITPVRFIEACRRRYGDLVTLRTLMDPGFVMVFDPELVKQVFRGPPDRLRAGEANAVLGPVVGERSVLLLDGAEHMRQRKLLLPPFHGERMRAYERVMRQAADREIDSWPVGEPFALLPSMQSLTLEVIMRAVFGVTQDPRREELKRRVRGMIAPTASRFGVLLLALSRGRIGTAAGDRFEERRRLVDELIYDEIAERRTAPDLEQREDIFSMQLLARDEDGREMTDRELRDELVTLLVAGHETTATGLSWAFELLMRNPPVLERLRAELADGEDAYLQAAVKEVLRLRPVIAGVGRVVRGSPFELGGYELPPGTEINPSIAGIHRRADRYPQPRAFRPERFLEPDPPDTYTWLPFGGGTRRCLGASFATFEMGVVIRRVLERADLAPADERPEKGIRKGITFVPEHGARMVQVRPPLPATVPEAEAPDRVAAASRSG